MRQNGWQSEGTIWTCSSANVNVTRGPATFHGTFNPSHWFGRSSVLPSENAASGGERSAVPHFFDPSEDISMVRAGMSANVEIDTGHTRTLNELL
jgi:hypothetical protein